MALNEIAKHFYEKEVERLLGLDDVKIIKENFLDMRSQIDDLYVELGDRARRIAELEEENRRFKAQGERIAELETELSVKEDLLKIKNGLCNEKSVIEILRNTPFVEDVLEEEPLPFSDEQHEEETKVELPTMPIDVASMLINARNGIRDKYSKDDLQEIIEHLRAFVDNPSDD